MADDARTVWTVGAAEDCDHLAEAIEHLGDDGHNAYFRCSRCGSTMVAAITGLSEKFEGRD